VVFIFVLISCAAGWAPTWARLFAQPPGLHHKKDKERKGSSCSCSSDHPVDQPAPCTQAGKLHSPNFPPFPLKAGNFGAFNRLVQPAFNVYKRRRTASCHSVARGQSNGMDVSQQQHQLEQQQLEQQQ